MNFDGDGMERFIVKSKHNPVPGDNDIRLYFVLFKACPFELQGVFAITKSMFGNLKDAFVMNNMLVVLDKNCLLYTSPSPRDGLLSRMPSSA